MKEYICYCQYCNKELKNKMSKNRHEYFCKLNPDYLKHLENHKNTTVKASTSKIARQKTSSSRKRLYNAFLKEHPEEAVQEYEFICERSGCGKHFFRKLKVKNFLAKKRLPRFCCNSCANSHTCTPERSKKISESVKKEREHICPKCGKHFLHKGTAVNILCIECKKIKCIVCDELFLPKGSEKICSIECRRKRRKENIQKFKKRIKRKWIPRTKNCESYPEKYWKSILIDLGIKFEQEVRCIPNRMYSLDFVIELKNGQKVDLEIDGKQHWYEGRRQYDEYRNKIVRANGFLVYRIDWNNLNSKFGKMKMKAKINQFKWWFNKVNV